MQNFLLGVLVGLMIVYYVFPILDYLMFQLSLKKGLAQVQAQKKAEEIAYAGATTLKPIGFKNEKPQEPPESNVKKRIQKGRKIKETRKK